MKRLMVIAIFISSTIYAVDVERTLAGFSPIQNRQRNKSTGQREAERLSDELIKLIENGKYDEALALGDRALTLAKIQFGTNHPVYARILYSIASTRFMKGDYSEAEPLLKQALSIFEKAISLENSDNIANVEYMLASIYIIQDDYLKAESVLLRLLKLQEQSIGTENPVIVTTLNSLALLYKEKGDYQQAEPLLVRLLKIWEKELGPEHPVVVASLNNLAEIYHDNGEYMKAEPLYLRALKIREKALGPEHPDVAVSLDNLALLYAEKGDYQQAEPLLLHIITVQVFGEIWYIYCQVY